MIKTWLGPNSILPALPCLILKYYIFELYVLYVIYFECDENWNNKVTNVYKTDTYFIITLTNVYINTYRKKNNVYSHNIMPIILSCDILSCTYFYYLYISYDWIRIFQSSSTQATILPSAPGNTLSSDEI